MVILFFVFGRFAQGKDDAVDDGGDAGAEGAEEKADRDGFVEGTVAVGDTAKGGDDVGQDGFNEGLQAADGDVAPVDVFHIVIPPFRV